MLLSLIEFHGVLLKLSGKPPGFNRIGREVNRLMLPNTLWVPDPRPAVVKRLDAVEDVENRLPTNHR